MNRFEGVLDVQVKTLLDDIDRDLAQRKRTIRQEADRDARLLLSLTRHRCRLRGRRAVAEERRRMAAALSRAEAGLASRRRQRQQAIDAARLARAFEVLREALQSRWADPSTQHDWVETAIGEAAPMLDSGGWQVELAPGTDEARVHAILASRSIDASLIVVADIEAGLRIRRGSACLDMTVDGLMTDENSLAGKLLGDLYRLQDDDRGQRHG